MMSLPLSISPAWAEAVLYRSRIKPPVMAGLSLALDSTRCLVHSAFLRISTIHESLLGDWGTYVAI